MEFKDINDVCCPFCGGIDVGKNPLFKDADIIDLDEARKYWCWDCAREFDERDFQILETYKEQK